jgi:large subunit ribosomal protein L21
MAAQPPFKSDPKLGLALAVVACSAAPLLLVDGDSIFAGADLGGASVTARVVGDEKGPKIRGFKYKNKSNQRTRWGHRQKYDLVEITGITKG